MLSIAFLAITSCKKEEEGATNVDIVFSEPSLGDTVMSYNQVHAEGTISGDGTMEGYHLSIFNSENGTVLYTNAYDVQAKSYNFHEHWINNLNDTTRLTVRVEVNKDKNGNKTTKEMSVVCLP